MPRREIYERGIWNTRRRMGIKEINLDMLVCAWWQKLSLWAENNRQLARRLSVWGASVGIFKWMPFFPNQKSPFPGAVKHVVVCCVCLFLLYICIRAPTKGKKSPYYNTGAWCASLWTLKTRAVILAHGECEREQVWYYVRTYVRTRALHALFGQFERKRHDHGLLLLHGSALWEFLMMPPTQILTDAL